MLTMTINPRFGDVDALGHINNIVPACWFEQARTPLFRIFDAELKLSRETWPLIMAHSEYDFVDQLFFPQDVEIHTWIGRIGTKSFTVCHEAWQTGRLCVKGSAVVVYYDFKTETSVPLPENKKKALAGYLKETA
jgi:acyl-CoA thioester hydrolase